MILDLFINIGPPIDIERCKSRRHIKHAINIRPAQLTSNPRISVTRYRARNRGPRCYQNQAHHLHPAPSSSASPQSLHSVNVGVQIIGILDAISISLSPILQAHTDLPSDTQDAISVNDSDNRRCRPHYLPSRLDILWSHAQSTIYSNVYRIRPDASIPLTDSRNRSFSSYDLS